MTRKKELEKEYREIFKRNRFVVGKDADRMDEIVKEWKAIVLKELEDDK